MYFSVVSCPIHVFVIYLLLILSLFFVRALNLIRICSHFGGVCWKSTLLSEIFSFRKIWSVQYNLVNYRHDIAQQMSWTEFILHNWNIFLNFVHNTLTYKDFKFLYRQICHLPLFLLTMDDDLKQILFFMFFLLTLLFK